MNVFDFALLCVLSIFGVIGAVRGLVRALFFLVTWIVAGAVAWLFSIPAADVLRGTIDEPIARTLSGFVLVFILVFVVGMVLSGFVHRFMESTPVLMVSNRVLGGIVGVLIGIVVVVVGFLLAGLTSLPQNGWWRHSSLAPYFESCAVFVSDFLPKDIARHIRYG